MDSASETAALPLGATAWRFPRFVRVLAVIALIAIVLFAGDDDVTWAEFRWNVAVGIIGVVGLYIGLFRPKAWIDDDGRVEVRNPLRIHRFHCRDVAGYRWTGLGIGSISLVGGQNVSVWVFQAAGGSSALDEFAAIVENHRSNTVA